MDALDTARQLGSMFCTDVQSTGHRHAWWEIVVDDRELPPCDHDDLQQRFGAVTDAMVEAYCAAFARTAAAVNDA